jgi:hypothetical protein
VSTSSARVGTALFAGVLVAVALGLGLDAGATTAKLPGAMFALLSRHPDWPRIAFTRSAAAWGARRRCCSSPSIRRNPLFYAREIAFSNVPLEIWWSTKDKIVVDGAKQSGLLYRAIKRLNPRAPVTEVVGTWRHTAEMRTIRRLPLALARIGLLRLAS